MTLTEKLAHIQAELKAPKSRYNSFGKYNYRSLEDICEGVKPLEEKYSVTLLIHDEVVEVGNRFYIKAVAELYDCESADKFVTSALAREAETKSGMDASQITGTASSYARKYCLNGLFLIDDTKDADTDEYQNESKARAKKEVTPKKVEPTVDDVEASEAEKESYKLVCKELELSASKYLIKAGWEQGMPVTKAILGKALTMVKNIADNRNA